MTYSEKVPVIVRSKIIDRVMGMMTKGELVRATTTWKQTHFSMVMSRLLQLPCTYSKGNGEVGKGVTLSLGSNPTASRFACSDLDLGKTSPIKHQIELTDWIPFKEHCQCIPPHMYDDVKVHLQEMLDIGAIRKSNSLWANMVVLVWKNDESLRFCIDLRTDRMPFRWIKTLVTFQWLMETCLGDLNLN